MLGNDNYDNDDNDQNDAFKSFNKIGWGNSFR
jgi:hypothetical protein